MAGRVIALEQRQITIQFRSILEYRDPRQHSDDLEDHFNLGLQIHKRGLPASFLERFAGRGENPHPGAAKKLQLRQIKDDVLDRSEQRGFKLMFQFGGRDGIKAAGKVKDEDGSAFVAVGADHFDFEWHTFSG